MKFGELYVHIYYYTLNNIFIKNYYAYMTQWRVTLWLYYTDVQYSV